MCSTKADERRGKLYTAPEHILEEGSGQQRKEKQVCNNVRITRNSDTNHYCAHPISPRRGHHGMSRNLASGHVPGQSRSKEG